MVAQPGELVEIEANVAMECPDEYSFLEFKVVYGLELQGIVRYFKSR